MRHALVVAAFGLLALPAEAGSLAKAKRFFRQAEARFKASDFEQAAKLYQQAYEAKAMPAFFINIGQCHRKMGDCKVALKYYRRYLAEDPSKRHQKKAAALIKVCEEEIAAREQLEKEAQQPPPEALPPKEAPPQPAPEQTSSGKGLHPLYFWSCVGVTGAMLLLGTVTGAVALGKSSDYKDPATKDAEAAALKDQGEDLKVASTVTFSFAVAAAVASAALYFFTDFSGAEPAPTAPASALMVAPLSGGAIVSFGSSF